MRPQLRQVRLWQLRRLLSKILGDENQLEESVDSGRVEWWTRECCFRENPIPGPLGLRDDDEYDEEDYHAIVSEEIIFNFGCADIICAKSQSKQSTYFTGTGLSTEGERDVVKPLEEGKGHMI